MLLVRQLSIFPSILDFILLTHPTIKISSGASAIYIPVNIRFYPSDAPYHQNLFWCVSHLSIFPSILDFILLTHPTIKISSGASVTYLYSRQY
ncbi:hypothetical protein [Limnospira platensis]|uniref:hypothetical protein n=1 Tax=Limnospira platensis TaxID=118562 RepID=UPI001378E1BE